MTKNFAQSCAAEPQFAFALNRLRLSPRRPTAAASVRGSFIHDYSDAGTSVGQREGRFSESQPAVASLLNGIIRTRLTARASIHADKPTNIDTHSDAVGSIAIDVNPITSKSNAFIFNSQVSNYS